MNDEVAKLPLSEGHNTALNRKAFRTAAAAAGRRRRRRRCRGLSDTRLIRGSSSEVVVCTMKHGDGATMTHMLHLTGLDLDVGLNGKCVCVCGKGGGDFPTTISRMQSFAFRAPAYWLDLRENALSLLISGPDSSSGDGEQ